MVGGKGKNMWDLVVGLIAKPPMASGALVVPAEILQPATTSQLREVFYERHDS